MEFVDESGLIAMKKWVCLALSLLLVMSFWSVAAAETATMPEVGVITRLENGTAFDLDGDGTADDVQFVPVERENEDYFDYTLSVDGQTVSGEGVSLNPALYALKLDEYSGTLLLVSDYGPSDDPVTYFYLYETGVLLPAGSIDAMPESMRVDQGVITAPVRGRVLYTWYHDADFALARAYTFDPEVGFSQQNPAMHIIPRYVYPMSLIITLKVDLPLQVSMTDDRVAATLPSGSQAVLCASDDVEWVCVQALDSGERGWLRLSEDGNGCLVNGASMTGESVFDGLIFAD